MIQLHLAEEYPLKRSEHSLDSVFDKGVLSSPNTVHLDVTYACNLKCLHCYSNAGSSLPNELTTLELRHLIDQMASMKTFRVIFGGGEPLLRDDILELIKHASENRIVPILTTNGMLIDEEIAHGLRKAGLRIAQITLNSAKAESHDQIAGCSGAFNKALEAAKLLTKNEIYVLIATVVMSCNLKEIPSILKLASEIHAPAYRLVRFIPIGRGRTHSELNLNPEGYKDLVEIFLRERSNYLSSLSIEFDETFTFLMPLVPVEEDWQSKPLGCPAAKTLCAVSPTGEVSPCTLFSETSLLVKLECDNVREKNFKEIWIESKPLDKLRRITGFQGKCMECKFLHFCGGGCRGIAFSHTGDLLQSDPLCPHVPQKESRIV